MGKPRTLTVCYTDIKGSAQLNDQLGNGPMGDLKTEHLRVEKELIDRNSGTWIKSLGDGSMSSFDSPAEAVKFAAEFQWMEAKHPGLQFWTFETKIGMAHGEVIVDDNTNDVNGKAADLGYRVVGQCEAGNILLDQNAHAALESQWGPVEADKYCQTAGARELKGLGKRELWGFGWKKYVNDRHSIATLVKEQLEGAHFELFNTIRVPLFRPGLVFWPVVPRPEMYAIHKGQLEAIRLLSFCGWKTHLFIADSDKVFEPDLTGPSDFEIRVRDHAKKIGVSLAEVEYLSRVFDSASTGFRTLLLEFKSLTEQFQVIDIFNYEGKSYQGSQGIVMDKTILNFLRTIFTVVAMKRFADQHEGPIMIISGVDESPKWKRFIEMRQLLDRANLICNPELKTGGHLLSQDSHPPIWRSKREFLQAMENSNLTSWAFDLFVLLPEFPKTGLTICNEYCSKKESCSDTPESCGEVKKFGENLEMRVKDRLGFW